MSIMRLVVLFLGVLLFTRMALAEVTVEKSEIGPNVSLEAGTRVTGSTLRHTIVGQQAKLTNVNLDGSMLGNRVIIDGFRGSTSLGDDAELSAT